MVSKGQIVGLDWNCNTRLHSQAMTGTKEKMISSISFKLIQTAVHVETLDVVLVSALVFVKIHCQRTLKFLLCHHCSIKCIRC